MERIPDQTNDLNGQQIYRLSKLYAFPEFVKDASSQAIYGDDELPSSAFADPAHRHFPVHTKAATWISTAFLLDQAKEHKEASVKYIHDRLSKAADYHGINKQFNELVKNASTISSEKDLTNSDFALIIDFPDGKSERHYPMRNTSEVKEAASYLRKYQDVIPLHERQTMAQRILDKACDLGAGFTDEMDNYLNKQAGVGVCAAKDAANLLQTRIDALKHKRAALEIRTELEKMAQTCKDHPEQVRSTGSLIKLATIVDNIDRAYNLHGNYSSHYPRPEDVLFGITVKTAEHVLSEHCVMTTGTIYNVSDLRRVKLADIKDVFGDEFAEEVSCGGLSVSPEKLADHAATLPRPDAQLLDKLLKDTGIAPVAKEASHNEDSVWFDKDFLHDLAAKR